MFARGGDVTVEDDVTTRFSGTGAGEKSGGRSIYLYVRGIGEG